MVYNTYSCTPLGCIQKMECNLWLIQLMGEWHNFEASDPHQWKMSPDPHQWKMTPPWEITGITPPVEIDSGHPC